jgi:hypothetical protein
MAMYGALRIRASRAVRGTPLFPTIQRMKLAAFWSAKSDIYQYLTLALASGTDSSRARPAPARR